MPTFYFYNCNGGAILGFVDDFVEKNRGNSDYYAELENFKKKLDEPNKTFNDPNQSHENITGNQSTLVDNRFRNSSENTHNHRFSQAV